jgi:hypothetical protein
MLDKFSTEALKEARKALENAHLAPPIEALAKAAVPLVREMLDKIIAARPEETAEQASPKSPGK